MNVIPRNGTCHGLKKTVNGAMQVFPCPKIYTEHADGLCLTSVSDMLCGDGLILDENSRIL